MTGDTSDISQIEALRKTLQEDLSVEEGDGPRRSNGRLREVQGHRNGVYFQQVHRAITKKN